MRDRKEWSMRDLHPGNKDGGWGDEPYKRRGRDDRDGRHRDNVYDRDKYHPRERGGRYVGREQYNDMGYSGRDQGGMMSHHGPMEHLGG